LLSGQVEIVQLNEDTGRFVSKAMFDHPYPTTKIMWAPHKVLTGSEQDLLATTGDYLRVWSIGQSSGEARCEALLNTNKNTEYCAPLTSFDWCEADAAVVVVGLSATDEGESMIGVDTASTQLLGGAASFRPLAAVLVRVAARVAKLRRFGGDRRDLRLRAADVALIEAVAEVNARTVVVVIGGGTIVVDPWDSRVAAVLLAWYPGMEGGGAVADVLFGDTEPAGRLPVAIPHRQADLPQLDWDADTVSYGRWWGQRALDRDGVEAAYPLGFGLGYTTFALADLVLGALAGERFTASVTVTNTGARAGRHVVQIYAVLPADTGRPVHHLVGFASVHLAPGAAERVIVGCSARPVARWTGDGFALPDTSVDIRAGAYAGDPACLGARLALGG
jgi:beta-glucosidase